MKRKPEIDPLNTIEEWLGILNFLTLTNSTPRRNLAHLLQLREFLKKIESNYSIEKGLGINYRYNIIRIESDVIETLLFCCFEQKGLKSPRGAAKTIKKAETGKFISKDLARRLQVIVGYRNDYHPDRQKELLVKVDQRLFDLSENAIEDLITELKKHFNPDTASRRCECCKYGLTKIGNFCLYCGDYNYGI